MGILLALVSVHRVCSALWRPEEDPGSPGTGAKDDCEPPHRCLGLNSDPLEEQPFNDWFVTPALELIFV